MSTTPPPNEEREKEYKLLRDKAQEIRTVIQKEIGETTSIFDLVFFSAICLLQARTLFPEEYAPIFGNVVRDCVTLSMDSREAIEKGTNQVEEIKKKPLLYDGQGNEIK